LFDIYTTLWSEYILNTCWKLLVDIYGTIWSEYTINTFWTSFHVPCKHNSSYAAYCICMQLYTFVVHYLQMCMKEYGCCPKYKRGVNSKLLVDIYGTSWSENIINTCWKLLVDIYVTIWSENIINTCWKLLVDKTKTPGVGYSHSLPWPLWITVFKSQKSHIYIIKRQYFYYTPEGAGGILFYLCPSVQDIFRRIFLSNCWWQKSDIWSQASHTYMKLVTKYQIPVINSCLEKCDEKCTYTNVC
jgi:hypothetical protein